MGETVEVTIATTFWKKERRWTNDNRVHRPKKAESEASSGKKRTSLIYTPVFKGFGN